MAKKVFKSISEEFEENDRLDFIEGWEKRLKGKKKKKDKSKKKPDQTNEPGSK